MAVRNGPKVSFTSTSLKLFNEDLNTLEVFAYAHDEVEKLSGQLLIDTVNQRWSPRGRPWPRGQILKSLALASKVKSLALALASRPQVLENWPVLGSRTTLYFELLKFCEALEKFFGKRVFVEIARKIFVKTFFFWRSPKNFL